MKQRGAIGWFKHDITHRGPTAWILAAILVAFYIFMYFGGSTLPLTEIKVPDIFQKFMSEQGLPSYANSKWTLYGALYSVAICVGGIFVILKYRHNMYQIVRTSVVMLTQVSLGFSIPILLKIAEQPEFYFSYFWPLKIEYLYPSSWSYLPVYMVLYTVIGSFVVVPLLSIIFGKRWYCSWICGCGGLANTFGEPWRRLSSKSNRSWSFEKVSIHTTLVICLVVTALVLASSILSTRFPEFAEIAASGRKNYGIWVGAVLSGVVGVALYPVGGTRIWCRFFCPMAAMIGLFQKIGRYRITVKENMCISCGMCSTYCEMGIDVRAYAQRNQSFVRASCVGCGICAEVCPRGVLRLEGKWDRDPQELSMSGLLNRSYKIDPHRKAS